MEREEKVEANTNPHPIAAVAAVAVTNLEEHCDELTGSISWKLG